MAHLHADGRSRACLVCVCVIQIIFAARQHLTLNLQSSPKRGCLSELNFGIFVICGLAWSRGLGFVHLLLGSLMMQGISSGSSRISATKNCKDTDLISSVCLLDFGYLFFIDTAAPPARARRPSSWISPLRGHIRRVTLPVKY